MSYMIDSHIGQRMLVKPGTPENRGIALLALSNKGNGGEGVFL